MLASTPGQSALDLYQVCLMMVSSLNSRGLKKQKYTVSSRRIETTKKLILICMLLPISCDGFNSY